MLSIYVTYRGLLMLNFAGKTMFAHTISVSVFFERSISKIEVINLVKVIFSKTFQLQIAFTPEVQ